MVKRVLVIEHIILVLLVMISIFIVLPYNAYAEVYDQHNFSRINTFMETIGNSTRDDGIAYLKESADISINVWKEIYDKIHTLGRKDYNNTVFVDQSIGMVLWVLGEEDVIGGQHEIYFYDDFGQLKYWLKVSQFNSVEEAGAEAYTINEVSYDYGFGREALGNRGWHMFRCGICTINCCGGDDRLVFEDQRTYTAIIEEIEANGNRGLVYVNGLF